VDVSRDELTIRFRALSDEELLSRLRAGTLTPLAAEVASAELRSRGIEPSSAPESEPELAQRFGETTNKELLNLLRAGTLTPLAVEVASAELRSRGVEPSPESESAARDNQAGVAHGDLVTVGEFWNPIEANLLRSLLQSEGIFVHLWGEHLGVAHTFLSVASGGMKVQVPRNQAAQARELIAAYKRGELALEEDSE
jgi:hypothetical protein